MLRHRTARYFSLLAIVAAVVACVPATALAAKKTQEIKFTSTAPSPATVGGSTYTVAATATSGLTVSFSSATPTVCTVSGATVSFVGAGTCTIDASQSGNGEWEAAPEKPQSFAVVKKTQEIKFTSTPPSPATIGGTYPVAATATSGLAVSFFSGTPSVCTVSGTTASFIAAGTCTIDASQSGNGEWEAAPNQPQSFEVVKKTQEIKFTSTAPSPATVGGSPYTVAAEGGASHEAVTFTIDAASASVCAISGTTVSFISVGPCTIDVNQAGNSEYEPAPQTQQSFGVGKGAQTINFTSTPPGSAAVGAPPYTVAAEGGESHNGLTFSIDASSAAVCTISGASVSFVGEGRCTIDVNQAGNSNYEPAQGQQSFPVGKGSQTIKFASTPPSSATVGGPDYIVAATTTSGLTVSFSSATPSVCIVAGTAVSFVGTGTCTIDANQGGSSGYKAALQVEQSLEVGIAIVLSTPPSTAPIIVHVTPPNSAFKTLGAVFNPTSHMITFTESVAEPGTFSWLLTFQNGKFGVFGRTSAKCKTGLIKLGGKCRPSKIVFAKGSASVTSAGTVTFALKPTASALRALKNAYRRNKSLTVAMTLKFQSVRSTSPVSRLLALTVRTR